MIDWIKRLPISYRMKVGRMSGRHGLYELGYIRATMVVTIRNKDVNLSKSRKITVWYELFSATRKHEGGIASNRISA